MRKSVFLLAPCVFLLTSCLGATMDITIRPNGSGRIVLEYRVSQMLESMGRLDGNERWPAIPVGRADFERSLARIPGMRLSSFSARNVPNDAGGSDLVTRAVLDFSNMSALLAFLDITGNRATLVHENGSSRLHLVLLDPFPEIEDAELLSLFREVSAGYEIRIGVNVPRRIYAMTVQGSMPPVRARTDGRNFSFAVDTGELPAISDGLALEISW